MKKLLLAAFVGALTLTACEKKTEVEETNTMMVEPDSSAMMMDSTAVMPMDSTAVVPMTSDSAMVK